MSIVVVNRPSTRTVPSTSPATHVVADLERAQHQDERAGGEVGQQAAPGGADRDAEAGDQRGERRRLDAEVAEDGDDQDDVQRDGDSIEPM